VAPSVDVTLQLDTFTDAAAQAGISRRYGGIHFEEGDLRAREMGRNCGVAAWHKAQSYFDGTATRP
ncbi:MAG: phosphoesterase, partial [Candidatus Eisenbacteria bacterium]|nr:phosphoesterase [Candidatus Eisenbacteria bacterium]